MEEEDEVRKAYAAASGYSLEEIAGGDVYIRDDYISDGPGYVGPVAIYHWGGDPTYISVAYRKETEFGRVWHFDRDQI